MPTTAIPVREPKIRPGFSPRPARRSSKPFYAEPESSPSPSGETTPSPKAQAQSKAPLKTGGLPKS
jgi:hypothetical protein